MRAVPVLGIVLLAVGAFVAVNPIAAVPVARAARPRPAVVSGRKPRGGSGPSAGEVARR